MEGERVDFELELCLSGRLQRRVLVGSLDEENARIVGHGFVGGGC